jgi:DNA modification methylase
MVSTLPKRISVSETAVFEGDCLELIPRLPDASIDVVVTSPPYWGQRESLLNGTEEDPRDYIAFLGTVFDALLPKLKMHGIVWLNLGDAYNTPVNWGAKDYKYSSLGADRNGFKPDNAAYTKPRFKRKAFVDKTTGWLQYGNLLMLPQRLLIALAESGYLYRGEVIWAKKNPMPEGRCRRPHRKHESIYLLARHERHLFRTSPPVSSVWEFANENIPGLQHRSRFPVELPRRCIEAYGQQGSEVVVLDPFSGSGSTGLAALQLGCTYIGFEIDPEQVAESRRRLSDASLQADLLHPMGPIVTARHRSETAKIGHLDL